MSGRQNRQRVKIHCECGINVQLPPNVLGKTKSTIHNCANRYQAFVQQDHVKHRPIIPTCCFTQRSKGGGIMITEKNTAQSRQHIITSVCCYCSNGWCIKTSFVIRCSYVSSWSNHLPCLDSCLLYWRERHQQNCVTQTLLQAAGSLFTWKLLTTLCTTCWLDGNEGAVPTPSGQHQR